MKRIFIILAAIGLCQSAMFGQKKYEMVVEKTDGTEVVFNVEDIVRTYFRERENGGSGENTEENWMVGEWQECNSQGVLYDDATGTEVMHMKLYSDNKGDWWSVTKGKVDDHRFSFTYSYTYDGNSYMVTQTITSSSRPYEVGMSQTTAVTYENGMFHGGEVYYKKIGGAGGGTSGETGGDDTAYTSCPDENHPHAIDLGLPSGTKWACCNVGASTPNGYGSYFAWGEIEEKSVYDFSTYKWCEGSYKTLTKYNTKSDWGVCDNYITLENSDDVAYMKWGNLWKMPTNEQMKELYNECSVIWTTQKSVNGFNVIGPNGTSIFFPASGYYDNSTSVNQKGKWAYYWTSSVNLDLPGLAHIISMQFTDGETRKSTGAIRREFGLSVRPVKAN